VTELWMVTEYRGFAPEKTEGDEDELNSLRSCLLNGDLRKTDAQTR